MNLLLVKRSKLLGQQQVCSNSIKKYSVDAHVNNRSDFVYRWQIIEPNFKGIILENVNEVTINWQNTIEGNYTIKVTKSASCGSVSEEFKVTLSKNMKLDILPIYYYCPDFSSISIKAPNGFDSYKWIDEKGIVVSNDQILEAKSEGVYRLVTQLGDCVSEAVTKVVLVQFPSVIVNTTLDNSIVIVGSGGNTNVQYQLETLKGDVIYSWQKSNTFFNVPEGKFIVKMKSINGECISHFEVETMIIPNLISPNNDGINDFWDLNDYLKNYSDAVIEVYDRFGKQIKVITKTEHFKWDGKIGGKPLPTDTYWFVIKLADNQTKSGSLLIKNK